MNKETNQKDYLANELINQNYYSRVADTIKDPNNDWVMKNTISDLPPKKIIVKDNRPLYSIVSGMEKLDSYDFFYKHFYKFMDESTFFTSNNVEKVKTMFPGIYTCKSVNGSFQTEINSFEQVQNILLSKRNLMNWVIVKKNNSPLLMENRKIKLSLIILFVITEKSIQVYLYDQGLILIDKQIYFNNRKNQNNVGEIKFLPDDFVNLYGSTFYRDKVIPQIKDTLRKGIKKFEKTIIRENGMRYKKNYLLYSPMEVVFEVDMNYKTTIQKIQKPKNYTLDIEEWAKQYKADINNIIYEPDAPNGFQIILNEDVYIPFAPEEKKIEKQKNQEKEEIKIVKKKPKDNTYTGKLQQDIKDTALDFKKDLGDFKWVLIAVVFILIFAGFFVLKN